MLFFFAGELPDSVVELLTDRESPVSRRRGADREGPPEWTALVVDELAESGYCPQDQPLPDHREEPCLLAGDFGLTITGASDQELVSEVRADGSIAQSERSTISLPDELERTLLNAYEFDGLFVEWPDKGSELAMIGMLKIDEVLAWRLDLTQSGGQHWNLYVDSHSGAIVKAELLGDDDQVEYTILQSDIRETDGFTYPHRIEYFANNGGTLAVEVIEEIEIEQAPFDLADESVTH